MKKIVSTALVLTLNLVLAAGSMARADGHNGDHGPSYSKASLHGTYVVRFQGWVSGGDGAVTGQSLGPQNGVGLLQADGNGNFTGTETANILYNSNGLETSASGCGGSSSVPTTAVCTTTLTGTYMVNSDGTGSTTATATPIPGSDCRCGPAAGFTTTTYFIMNGENHISIVGTDSDATVSGQASRQR